MVDDNVELGVVEFVLVDMKSLIVDHFLLKTTTTTYCMEQQKFWKKEGRKERKKIQTHKIKNNKEMECQDDWTGAFWSEEKKTKLT